MSNLSLNCEKENGKKRRLFFKLSCQTNCSEKTILRNKKGIESSRKDQRCQKEEKSKRLAKTKKDKIDRFFKMAHPQPLFHIFSSFQTNNTIFTTSECEKISIQYMVPGFEPTTFGK